MSTEIAEQPQVDAIGGDDAGGDFAKEFIRLTTDQNAVANDGSINPVAKAFEDAENGAQRPEQAKQPDPKTEPAKEQPKGKVPDALFKQPEQKKEEPPSDAPKSELDAITAPEFKSPKHKEQWDALKTKATEFERKAAELEAKIKDADTKGKDSEALQAKLADLEKKNTEYLEIVRRVNAEADPEFRQKFVEGRSALVGDAKKLIEDSGGNADDVATALALKGKSRIEALRAAAEGLDGFSQGRLGRIIDQIDSLDKEAEGIRQDPEKFIAERAEQEQARIKQQQAETLKIGQQAFTVAESKLSNELEVLQKVDGFDEWNRGADEIRANAKRLFETNRDPEVWAQTAIKALASDTYRNLFLEERKASAAQATKIAEMEKELSGIYNKSPRLNGGKSNAGTTNVKDMDFTERFAHETAR